jgi:uncharacterized protein YdcH (DUF465 family)
MLMQFIPTEPVNPDKSTRRGAPTSKENHPMEKISQEELKAYLMQSNQEFRDLAEKHAEYKRLIEQIETKPHLTAEDEIEEQRLKKLKLHLKDQMQEIMNAQNVA